MATALNDHVRVDERSLALHALVAEKLLRDPSIIALALENIRRWTATSGYFPSAYAEWDDILKTSSPQEIAALLVEPSEHATRLRQSSPFAGVLTEAERNAIHESFTTRAYYSRGQ